MVNYFGTIIYKMNYSFQEQEGQIDWGFEFRKLIHSIVKLINVISGYKIWPKGKGLEVRK